MWISQNISKCPLQDNSGQRGVSVVALVLHVLSDTGNEEQHRIEPSDQWLKGKVHNVIWQTANNNNTAKTSPDGARNVVRNTSVNFPKNQQLSLLPLKIWFLTLKSPKVFIQTLCVINVLGSMRQNNIFSLVPSFHKILIICYKGKHKSIWIRVDLEHREEHFHHNKKRLEVAKNK